MEKYIKKYKIFYFYIEDPDVPIDNWYHLILININKSVNKIEQNTYVGKSIKNSWGNNKYKRLQTPSRTYYYHFIVYALDVENLNAK